MKLLALVTALAFAMTANATITASVVDLGSPLGDGTWTIDIVVTLTDTDGDPDDWTACGMEATLDGAATFINDDPYNPPIMPTGDTVYDSFFTSPEWFPNTSNIGFVYPAGVVEDPQHRFGEWYDTADTGNGTFVMHRLSVNEVTPFCLHIFFETAAANTGGELFQFYWNLPLPEPTSLALLALGGLALIRRR